MSVPFLFTQLRVDESDTVKHKKSRQIVNDLVDTINKYTRDGQNQEPFQIQLMIAEIGLASRQLIALNVNEPVVAAKLECLLEYIDTSHSTSPPVDVQEPIDENPN